MEPIKLTTAQIAERYQVSLVTAQRWCRQELFPRVREGRDWRILESDLTGFVPPKLGNPAGCPIFGPKFWTKARIRKRRKSLSSNNNGR